MTKYTTQVRTICEVNGGYDESQGFDNVEEVINKAIPNIFNFDFPIYDPSYKNVLCHKILLEYYTREIAFETVGLWKLKLRAKLNKIMPYYNQLYKSELLEFNPFYDIMLETKYNKTGTDKKLENENYNNTTNENYTNNQTKEDTLTNGRDIVSSYTENNTGTSNTNSTNKNTSTGSNTNTIDNTTVDNITSNSSSTNTNKVKDRESDTPQSKLSDIENDTYLTRAKIVDGNDSSLTDSTQENRSTNTQLSTGENQSKSDDVFASVGGMTNSTTGGTNTSDVFTQNAKEKMDSNSNKNADNFGSRNLSGDLSTLEDYIQNVKGKTNSMTYSKMLEEFRETFLNIDSMILDELSDLFFNLY